MMNSLILVLWRASTLIVSIVCLIGCSDDTKLFKEILVSQSGVDFANRLTFIDSFNVYTYRNFYNGGGVAIADYNGDGLEDIYLSGNMVPNKLYRNLGGLKFEDATDFAGVAGKGNWSTGVLMTDLTGDGLADIYVCNSGGLSNADKRNEFFVNQGDGTFLDLASQYGIDDQGLSTHAVCLDFDRDGDLDIYLLNNSFQAIGSFNLRKQLRNVRDSLGGDKLFRNDGNRFTDVSEQMGIYGSVIGFGLGASVTDFNADGYPDLYISNDFFEHDYLYINREGKFFEEMLKYSMPATSAASMGSDVADLNNDGYPELFVTEMLPRERNRLMTKTTFENWNRYQYGVASGYHHQFTRNVLQVNNGDGTFSEIGRLADVHATDWSWGALFADFDLDGYTDLFVSNGVRKDLTDQDYLKFIAADETKRMITSGDGVDFKKLVNFIPQESVPNYVFKGSKGFQFTEIGKEWGLDAPSFSNGAAYADLDNDGDLDLVVNRLDTAAVIYQNLVVDHGAKGLVLHLKDTSSANQSGIGSKIEIEFSNGTTQHYYIATAHGFQSSTPAIVSIALPKPNITKSITVRWPTGAAESFLLPIEATNLASVTLERGTGTAIGNVKSNHTTSPISQVELEWQHKEDEYIDFDRDFLNYHAASSAGPAIAHSSKTNLDDEEVIFIGGAHNQSSTLLYIKSNGAIRFDSSAFADHIASEDVQAVFVDIDSDGDEDLLVGSAGSLLPEGDQLLKDRLYLNGKDGFVLANWQGESMQTGAIVAGDFDGDNDQDILTFGRLITTNYGLPPDAYYYENSGKQLQRNTPPLPESGKQYGMITDAVGLDIDNDGFDDLVTVGEWTRPRFHFGSEKGLSSVEVLSPSIPQYGFWQSVTATDVNHDGLVDFVFGNVGLNTRLKASKAEPLTLLVADFDNNGTIDPIVITSDQSTGKEYPFALKHNLEKRLPGLRKSALKYELYRSMTVQELLGDDAVLKAGRGTVNETRSAVCLNLGNRVFKWILLPVEAQFSSINFATDIDFEGCPGHLLVGGNLYTVQPEIGRYDASYGNVLEWRSDSTLIDVTSSCGLRVKGVLKDVLKLRTVPPTYLAIRNDAAPLLLAMPQQEDATVQKSRSKLSVQ